MRQTPAFQWSTSGSCTHRLSDRLEAVLAANYRHSAQWFTSETNESPVGGFHLLDLSLGFQTTGGRWRLQAGVTNLTDEDYAIGGFRLPLLVDSVFLNEPRTIRVTFGFSY